MNKLKTGALPLITAAIVGLLIGALLLPFAVPDNLVDRAIRLNSAAGNLNIRLLTASSATETLAAWCREHQLASSAVITAHRDSNASAPPTADQRAQLGIGPDEPVNYRRVELRCGDVLMSKAENWYVPSRLTEPMRRQLTDLADNTPFGTVIKPLAPTRRTLGATHLLAVLPPAWETQSNATVRRYVARHEDALRYKADRPLFRHEAIIIGTTTPADGRPVALVHETYQMGTLRHLENRHGR
ncbi:hypothetical protein [Lentzea flava]|uniref:Uncharacterized protein n=1 Tax=Lentzea flava TaxID=103732 RepID=A0ABQ2UQU6_9PSEU|nr:hypothetical protein [Lentzea flava]MCP2200077.1 hypothetical protein [Lentzea flava]GGU45965.1 hypothetical protein GCM10010178_43120 [Lentzea flava]